MDPADLEVIRDIDAGLASRIERETKHDGTLDIDLRLSATEAILGAMLRNGLEGDELNSYGLELERLMGEFRNSE